MIALAPPMLLVAGGVALLRYGWRRTRGAVLAAWALLVAGLVWLMLGDGAWGLSAGLIVAMLVAWALLGHAALTSPERPRPMRAEREPSIALRPEGARGVARRLAIFLLSVPFAGLVAGLFALALQASALGAGMSVANATAMALLVFPIGWGVLTLLVLLEERALAMLRMLGIIGAIAGTVFWLTA